MGLDELKFILGYFILHSFWLHGDNDQDSEDEDQDSEDEDQDSEDEDQDSEDEDIITVDRS